MYRERARYEKKIECVKHSDRFVITICKMFCFYYYFLFIESFISSSEILLKNFKLKLKLLKKYNKFQHSIYYYSYPLHASVTLKQETPPLLFLPRHHLPGKQIIPWECIETRGKHIYCSARDFSETTESFSSIYFTSPTILPPAAGSRKKPFDEEIARLPIVGDAVFMMCKTSLRVEEATLTLNSQTVCLHPFPSAACDIVR